MSERGSLRIKAVLLALALAAVAGIVGAVALVLAPGGGDAGADVVAVAFRTDGGSPAVTVAYGNTSDVELDLPAGEYEVELAYGDVIFDMGRQPGGQPMRFGKVTDPGRRNTYPDVAAALRTVAGFASDAEGVRLDMLSSASAGYTQPLFHGEPAAADFERFYTGYRALGNDEAALTAALKLLDGRLASVEPPRYVRANGGPPAGLLDKLLDSTMPEFFNRIRKLPERERARVIEIVARMDGTEKQEAFAGLPPNLRGNASSYEEWVQSVKGGDLDEQLGAIHGYLYTVATGATQDAGHTPGQSMAEEGGPLVQSGIDLEVKAYGKVPNVGKIVDVTKKSLEWEAYIRKLYADPNAGGAALLKGPYQAFVKDKIKKDLRKAMPDAPDKVIDTLASQLAKGIASTLASGLATPTLGGNARGGGSSGYPPLSEADATDTPEPTATPDATEEWIESIVETVAQQLLASGESGIDVALATDDLRICLRQTQEAGLSRAESLSTCAYVVEGDGPPSGEPPAEPTAGEPTPPPASEPTAPPEPTLAPPPPTVAPPPPAPAPTKAPCASFDPACGLGAH